MSYYHQLGNKVPNPFQAPPPWWIIVPALALIVGTLFVIMENQ